MKADRANAPPSSLSDDQTLADARQIGLRYVRDDAPGIARMPAVNGFRYADSDGKPIDDEAVLARIKSLAIPPAWTEV